LIDYAAMSDPPFITFMKYISILGYNMNVRMKNVGEDDELSLFYVRMYDIARTLPLDFSNSMGFPIFDLSEDAIKEKAAGIIRRLATTRQEMELGVDAFCRHYIKIRNKSPDMDIPDLTIKRMAKDLGVSYMTIRRFEKGEADGVTTGMVFRYAERLNLWLGLHENKSPKETEWEHFAMTCGMLHKTAERVLERRVPVPGM